MQKADDLLARSDLSFVAFPKQVERSRVAPMRGLRANEDPSSVPPTRGRRLMLSSPRRSPASDEMTTRSAQLYRLARVCAARAAAATDAVTRARFLQEEQEWTARAREAEQEEREQHGPFTAP
jgi:hypothetical protein